MNDSETLVALWQSARATHAHLWLFYAAIVLAALGFCMTKAYAKTALLQRIALGVVLYVLLSVNGWSIWDNLALYNTATEQLQALASTGHAVGTAAQAIGEIDRVHLLVVHGMVDLCVLVVVFFRGRH